MAGVLVAKTYTKLASQSVITGTSSNTIRNDASKSVGGKLTGAKACGLCFDPSVWGSEAGFPEWENLPPPRSLTSRNGNPNSCPKCVPLQARRTLLPQLVNARCAGFSAAGNLLQREDQRKCPKFPTTGGYPPCERPIRHWTVCRRLDFLMV